MLKYFVIPLLAFVPVHAATITMVSTCIAGPTVVNGADTCSAVDPATSAATVNGSASGTVSGSASVVVGSSSNLFAFAAPASSNFEATVSMLLTTAGPVRPGYLTLESFQIGSAGTPTISVSINGVDQNPTLPISTMTMPFSLGTEFAFDVTYALSGLALSGGSAFSSNFVFQLRLQDTNFVDLGGGFLIPTPGENVDIFEVAETPEPSTILLGIAGLAGAAARRKWASR